MQAFINMVGTRVPGGDIAAALRWYADHIVQLLAFDGLRSAWLLQRSAVPVSGPAPDLLCCYDFGTAESFAAYESSNVHAAAAADRLQSWGRDGIAITSRLQYRRLWQCSSSAGLAQQTFDISAGSGVTAGHVARTLAADAQRRGVQAAQLLDALGAPGLSWLEAGADAPFSVPAAIPFTLQWQARFTTAQSWAR
jgi:hypothetical protein